MNHSSKLIMWVRRTVFSVMGMLLLGLAPSAGANPPVGPWVTDLEKGMAIAQRENKPVVVMFSAVWCTPCEEMKKSVFPDSTVQQTLASWVPVYLDEAQASDLVKRFKIEGFPTFVLLTNKGVEQDRFMGMRSAGEFTSRLKLIQDFNRQLADIEARLSKTPDDAKLWKEKGDLLTKIDMLEQGLAAYKKAQSLDPGNKTGVAADIYFIQTLMMNAKDANVIDERLAKMGQLYPDSPRVGDAAFMRVLIALNQKRMDDARGLLRTYLDRYPNGRFAKPAAQILKDLDQPTGARSRSGDMQEPQRGPQQEPLPGPGSAQPDERERYPRPDAEEAE